MIGLDTEDHERLRELARSFAEKEIAPLAAEVDRQHRHPAEAVTRAGGLDLLGLLQPPEYGGMGMDHVAFVILIEELAAACASTSFVIDVHCFVAEMITQFGTDDQKRRFLPSMVRGDELGAFCLTEPEAGSDAGSIRSSIRRDGDDYVLHGHKIFITNGGPANIYVVIARHEDDDGAITALIVEKGMKRFTFGQPFEKMGLNGAVTGDLYFDDCRVPVGNRLGAEGQGFRIALWELDRGRVAVAAQALGVARAALDYAIAYTKQRKQFGRCIADFQSAQFTMADMATKLRAARALTYEAARKIDDDAADLTPSAAMAKLFATEMCFSVVSEALQLLGGHGYMRDHPLERMLRDSRAFQLYEGTSQIQRVVIARDVIGAISRSQPRS